MCGTLFLLYRTTKWRESRIEKELWRCFLFSSIDNGCRLFLLRVVEAVEVFSVRCKCKLLIELEFGKICGLCIKANFRLFWSNIRYLESIFQIILM